MEKAMEFIKKRKFELIEEEKKRQEEEQSKLNDTTKVGCVICHDEECEYGIMMTKCGHTMCTGCTTNLLTQPLTYYGQRFHRCPVCRTELSGVGAIQPIKQGATSGDVYKLMLDKKEKTISI
jgi:hypothetical protein